MQRNSFSARPSFLPALLGQWGEAALVERLDPHRDREVRRDHEIYSTCDARLGVARTDGLLSRSADLVREILLFVLGGIEWLTAMILVATRGVANLDLKVRLTSGVVELHTAEPDVVLRHILRIDHHRRERLVERLRQGSRGSADFRESLFRFGRDHQNDLRHLSPPLKFDQ